MTSRDDLIAQTGRYVASALALLLELHALDSRATPGADGPKAPAVESEPEMLTTEEVAQRFRTSPSSVAEWRHTKTGPRGTRYGKRVLYRLEDVLAWERDQYESEHGREMDRVRLPNSQSRDHR